MKKNNKYTIDGKEVPSVTTICKALPQDEGLLYWYGRVGNKEAKRVMEEAGDFGSDVHSIIEAVIKGQVPDLDEDMKKILDNFKAWSDEHVESWDKDMMEIAVHNAEHGYGGTVDAVATLKDGKRYLIDFKTSSKVRASHYVQLAAYAESDDLRGKLDGAKILWLNKKTKIWECLNAELTGLFDIFLCAKKLWHWSEGK